MTLPSRLKLYRREVKGRSVLALDTGFDAESLEGLRLVRASRGAGWFFYRGALSPWMTKGVLQERGRLLIWGELDVPSGESPEFWPLKSDALAVFTAAWTAVAQNEPLAAFGPSSAVPMAVDGEWAFALLPSELAAVLDSMHPLASRLPWDHLRHPELKGEAGWAFASAALAVLAAGPLPWEQEDEASLRQEIRDLKKTLRDAELPDGPPEVRQVWLDSLKGKGTAQQWRNLAAATAEPDTDRQKQRLFAAQQRLSRRKRTTFWRHRGALVTTVSVIGLIVAGFAASMLWGWLKPDPTDTWTGEQVVRGYYQALSSLDSQLMRRLTAYDRFREPALAADLDQATSLYVLKQVRTAYEKLNPIFDAQAWEDEGKPDIRDGRQLYGLAGVVVEGGGDRWTARYRRWVGEGGGGDLVTVTGTAVTDHLKLIRTGRGWKISSLSRDSQPLP